MKIDVKTSFVVELSNMEASALIDALEDWTAGRLTNRNKFHDPTTATRKAAAEMYDTLRCAYESRR